MLSANADPDSRDGQVQVVTGSPGGRTIPNTTLWVVLNLLEGLSPRAAIDASRTHHQWFRTSVLEGRSWPDATAAAPDHGAQVSRHRSPGQCQHNRHRTLRNKALRDCRPSQHNGESSRRLSTKVMCRRPLEPPPGTKSEPVFELRASEERTLTSAIFFGQCSLFAIVGPRCAAQLGFLGVLIDEQPKIGADENAAASAEGWNLFDANAAETELGLNGGSIAASTKN